MIERLQVLGRALDALGRDLREAVLDHLLEPGWHDQIRRDLLRYDARWPERRFWLAGDIDVHPEANQRLRVTFPLRYELTRKSERASGTVEKTLLLQKTVNDDLEIVAVNEKKIK